MTNPKGFWHGIRGTQGVYRNLDAPVVLGGQNSSLVLHLWNAANATTAPSWALEMAWWER